MMEKDKYQYEDGNELTSIANKIQRETESMDDFEHVVHVTPFLSRVPDFENDTNAASSQLVNVPCAPNHPIGITTESEITLLDSTVLSSSNAGILQPVLVTPPSFVDIEKFDSTISSNAQSLDPLDGSQDQVFQTNSRTVKSVTMAFIQTEKSESYKKLSSELEGGSCKVNNFCNDHDNDDNGDDTEKISHDNEIQVESRQCNISPDSMCETVVFPIEVHKDNLESANDLDHEHMPDMTLENGNRPQEKKQITRDSIVSEIKSTVFPAPQTAPTMDFLTDDASHNDEDIIKEGTLEKSCNDDTWNLLNNTAPIKPLPPLPIEFDSESDGKYEKTIEFPSSGIVNMTKQYEKSQEPRQQSSSTNDLCDLDLNTELEPFSMIPEQKPAIPPHAQLNEMDNYYSHLTQQKLEEEIAPRKIFSDMGLDAWFNPERLNPKVAALIYWRQPEKTGMFFGVIVGVLLSLACFSLISVFSYVALFTLMGTMGFRIYKTIMQAVQKTSDGHPFKDILEIDLTLPAEKVHEVADVAVAHANAAVSELRRLFLIEDFVDSLKFCVVLWCLTYLGSWFNGMTLIIIGVIALFTLPKVYETNKLQIDQNLALVHGKINDLTAKVKAAIPLGKKAEPTKEE